MNTHVEVRTLIRSFLRNLLWLAVSVGTMTPLFLAHAQGSLPAGQRLNNPLQANTIQEFFKILIDILLVFAVPIIVFFIIYAGFLYVTAQGNAEKIKNANRAITWTLIGGVLVLGAWSLVAVIQGTVNALK